MDTRAAFALLEVPPGSAPDAIRDAYRDLAKVWHPDRFAGEHERTTWLPAGTRLDLQRGTLSCAPPAMCDASFRPNGASRLALRGATAEDAHDVDVLFASATVMLWLVHPAGDRVATPARIVLKAQGDGPATAVGP